MTRVLVDASDGHDVWGSIGVSENVIGASWDALVDSLEYGTQAGARPGAGRAREPAGQAKRSQPRRAGAARARTAPR